MTDSKAETEKLRQQEADKQQEAEKLRRDELEDRAQRPVIVHETVPGEDPIAAPDDPVAKEKASRSTSDEDLM